MAMAMVKKKAAAKARAGAKAKAPAKAKANTPEKAKKAKAKAPAKQAKTPKAKAKPLPKAKAKARVGASPSRTLAAPAAVPSSSRPRPSERALSVTSQLPEERPLTDEEREAMAKVAQTALLAVGADGEPAAIVTSIAAFVDDIRGGNRQAPTSQDVRLGLGVLWGEQVRAQVGWRWVHLSYPNGFASYALVPDDRAFACFPLNRVAELLSRGAEGTNTSVPLFESIRTSSLPARYQNAYLVIG